MKKAMYREFHNLQDDPANQTPAENEVAAATEEGAALASGPEGGE